MVVKDFDSFLKTRNKLTDLASWCWFQSFDLSTYQRLIVFHDPSPGLKRLAVRSWLCFYALFRKDRLLTIFVMTGELLYFDSE